MIQNPDPRIHFALNCASLSCPPIWIYSAENLDAQVDLAARSFVDTNVMLNIDGQTLIVPAIFRWYRGDFGGREGVVSFLIDHLPFNERKAWLQDHREDLRLRYEPYDWSLNVTH